MSKPSSEIRVLHVDDDPDFAELTVKFLERQHDRIVVETADSGMEAIDQLAKSNFDCIVSDYEMPGQNGIQLLESVREEHPELPFILYTGKGSEEVASDAISAGVTDYLQKGSGSSQYEVLVNRIQNAVAQQRAREEAAETEQRLQTIAENTNDILWKFTAEWDELLFINSPYEEIWGRSVSELRDEPQSFLRGIHPEDRQLVKEAMDQVSAGDPVDIEFRVNADEDYGRWVWAQGEPVFDATGEVEKVVGFARDITEWKTQADRFEALIEQSSDVITVIDDEGTITFESPSVERILGYEPEELIGETAFDYIHPADRGAVLEAFNAFIEEPESVEEPVSYRFQHGDGSWVWLETDGRHLSRSGIEGFVLNSRDITARKERELELRQEKAFNTAALEGVVDFYWVIDLDGYVTHWSDTDGSVTGYTAEEAVGLHSSTFHPDGHFPRIEEAIEEIKETGETQVEADLLTKDGERRHYFFTGVALTDENGEIHSMCGTGRDITERKERDQELEAAQELTQALSTTFPDYTFIYNAEGEYLDVITGWEGGPNLYSPEEIIGQNLDDLLDDETAEKILTAIRTTLETGELQTIEYSVQTPGGAYWYEANLAPLEAGYGGEPAVVLTARDISERKKREEELQRQNERLEEFASVVSHDLRNPLTVAEGHLQLAIEERDWEEIDAVMGALERMETLIDNMLSLANAGESLGDLRAVDLSELTDACWQNVETRSATLLTETRASLQADKTRLQQLLENLLRNAVEHGGNDVTITIGDLDNGFYIEDDGPGIPRGEREAVLEAGYSKREDGTGFGLSIVRDIVEAHGWDITVMEGSKDGARFEITGVELVAD